MEDKQKVCDLLCKTLMATRNHKDLECIDYNKDSETVTLFWQSGTHKTVNVAMDSGTAIIRDIMRNID